MSNLLTTDVSPCRNVAEIIVFPQLFLARLAEKLEDELLEGDREDVQEYIERIDQKLQQVGNF